MKKTNKQMKTLKLFGLLFMSAIIALTPLFANLNAHAINTVFASSTTTLDEKTDVEKDKILLDKKVYYDGTVEDDFKDNSVIIVLNEKETHKFKTYTPEDFSEIGCVSVRDLTGSTLEYVKEQINNRQAGIKKNENSKLVNVGNYRRILSLELGEKNKENVIRAIRLLEKREEIVSAEPNFVITLDWNFHT